MTKENEKETVTCPIHNVEMLIKNCIARQRIVAEKPTEGMQAEAYKLYKKTCGECKLGIELYQKANENTRRISEKASKKTFCEQRIQAYQPKVKRAQKTPKNESGQNSTVDTKTCPCGLVFVRAPDTSNATWARSKYCAEHSAMTPRQRDRDIQRILAEKQKPETPKPTAESKICENENCGKTFFKPEDLSIYAWKAKKYCCDRCAVAMERKHDAIRKQNDRKRVASAKKFNAATAEKIATEVTEKHLSLITPFLTGSQQIDQLRTLAIRVSVDSQKQAHDLTWGRKR